MKILNGITQCESVSYKDAMCYMVSKNYGRPYFTAPYASWQPLGFERSIVYG